MKTQPIVPATITYDDDGTARAPAFDDVYHPAAGALDQALHVFLRGNDLPARWAGRRRFVIVETGFGLGNNFLATWQAWRDDPGHAERLVYVSIDKHPPRREDLQRAHRASALPDLAAALVEAWPPLTPNLHLLDFDGGAVRLLLALGDVAALVGELQLTADAFYLDGFAPARNPAMWDERVVKALARLAAPGATAATWSVARPLRDTLTSAGFLVERSPGFDRKREMMRAVFAPAFVPRRSPGRTPALATATDTERHALIIGGGLAGASAAEALARQGWRCTVLDRHDRPAGEASGNPGGLFHGTAHASDGVHARFTRAAALFAARRHAAWIASGRVDGQCGGLVRLRPSGTMPELPADYLQALDTTALRDLTGLPLDGPAWLYPGGGWVSPAALTAIFLEHPAITWQGACAVDRVARRDGHWRALDARGAELAHAPVLVLAQGVQPPVDGIGAEAWPLARLRGQVTWFESDGGPLQPVAGHGYALSLPGGRLLCGATSTDDDAGDSGALRADDHAFNLDRLHRLTSLQPPPGAALQGRVGWRATTPDRLPIVGAVPLAPADIPPGTRLDQARLVPRMPGLFVVGGLASRGLTWAPLAAEVLAAWIDGAPLPLEADLLDAIDPARWLVRAARRSGR